MTIPTYKTLELSEDMILVDLAEHAEKLLAYEDISDDLSAEQEGKVVEFVRACLALSYSRIKDRHSSWQEADRAHDVWIPDGATDFREKLVISDTRAIADTVLTYNMAALFGRNPMFQLEGLDRDSRKGSTILERLLHQHMRRTAGEARMAQHVQDSIRYGFAPTKVVWNNVRRTNDIINFDPRRAFPDPRVTWGSMDGQQFYAFSDECSTSTLLASQLYPKLRKYPGLHQTNRGSGHTWAWDAHQFIADEGRGYRVNQDSTAGTDAAQNMYRHLDTNRMVDELWVRLMGWELNLPGIDTIWLVVSIIDERAVIRLQLNPYGRQFPTVTGGAYFDAHKNFGQSLYDLLMPMHELANWLLRSRVDNVKAALNNLIFVDPTRVNITDLIDRNPWGLVRTLPGTSPGEGVKIQEVPDVTRGHWSDIAALSDLKNRVSAASDAQQGVPTADGVRTATEIQRLTQLGSQRLGVMARLMSAHSVRPLARMMVANLQDAVEYNASIRIHSGDQSSQLAGMDVKDGYIDVTSSDIQGDIDYLVVDGTLPVEPTRNADTWINIIKTVTETGLNMEYKTGKMVEEAIRAMGLPDLDQFKISDEEAKQGMTPSQEASQMERQRGVSVMPAEQMSREIERGNLRPANSR